MRILFLFLMLTAWVGDVSASDYVVSQFRCAGPFVVAQPVDLDSIGSGTHGLSADALLDEVTLSLGAADDAPVIASDRWPMSDGKNGIMLLGFDVEALSYTKVRLQMKGLNHRRVYMDGVAATDEVTLKPGFHRFAVKCLFTGSEAERPSITLSADSGAIAGVGVTLAKQGRPYTMHDVMDGRRLAGIEISHNGRYLIEASTNTLRGGRTNRQYVLRDLKSGRVLRSGAESIDFLPGSDDLLMTRSADGGRQLVRVGIADGTETVLASGLPDGDNFRMAPDGSYVVLSHRVENARKDKDVYEILEPDDRQPGWRDRMQLRLYNLRTGVMRPLTGGNRNAYLLDISRDSRYVLFMTSRSRLTQRPTTLFSVYRLNVETMQTDELIHDDGFIVAARFSPDGKQIVVKGSPECLGGIGCNVPEGRIPSMVDYQLYTLDIATRKVVPLTRDFNPSVEGFMWSPYDGQLWLTALDKDYCRLFRCDPKKGSIVRVDVPEDMVSGFAVSGNASVAAWYGESVSNSDRLYTLDMKSGRSVLVEDLSRDILKGVSLGQCSPWSFVSSRGDTISCRYYLPSTFDSNKRYPMIVNYYGGCSPTSRNFETRYPHHVYASMGYVVLVVNPSGAAGFGQEFSSRHVNTAGQGVADDIIEATRRFCEAHPFVNAAKVGCIGASYGGFMTQYLQTQTDLFAAAISHAGISDHTSYWGQGYWGYSYSEVSMAGSYPWTRKDLYVDQSPLFNADKVHTPLLFLHGSKDTNVPVAESIQMFTALKLLGRPTAFVVVDGQDHHVTDYAKRLKWQDTIFAWFQKWLQDDSSWWNAMYPEDKK